VGIPVKDVEHYRSLALEAGRELDGAQPQDIVRWAVDTFGAAFCIATSMADAVLVDIASKAAPGIDVVFLDTGYHFAETLQTRDRVAERYAVKVHSPKPRLTVAEQDAAFGPRLHDRDPDACCSLRKIEPLARFLGDYHAWASGMRRDESPSRKRIGVVEWDRKRSMVKVNPLAAWTQEQVTEYIIANDVEMNPLTYEGYPSIGCAPCTRRVLPGEQARAGRWAGTAKLECGLHTD
jgi:phosphoadenosine phosphosulfate reductase